MARLGCILLSILFHGGSAATLILISLGGLRPSEVGVAPASRGPVSFDVVEFAPTTIEFAEPTLPSTRLEVEDVPPVDVPFEPSDDLGIVEPAPRIPAPNKPVPEFGRPLPPSTAAQRLASPPPATQAETEQVAVEIYNPPPEYPLAARRRKIEGYVLVEVTVLKDGTCGEAKIVEQSDFSAFGESALQSVRTWKFQPATRDGQPVQSTQRIRFTFKLRG